MESEHADVPAFRIGYLEIVEFSNKSVIQGGLLVVDELTRPYEFSVTTELQPTLMQKILHGATLEAQMYRNLIAEPLVNKSREPILAVLVTRPLLLELRSQIRCPLACVEGNVNDRTSVGITVNQGYAEEHSVIREHINSLLRNGADILEPFGRVRLAIEEYHRSSTAKQ